MLSLLNISLLQGVEVVVALRKLLPPVAVVQEDS